MAYDDEQENENWRARVRICGPASLINVKDNTTYCFPNRNTWQDCLFQMRLYDINPRKWQVEGLRNRENPPRCGLHENVSELLRHYQHRLGSDVPHRVFLVPKSPGESSPVPDLWKRESMLHRLLRRRSNRLVEQQPGSSTTAQMSNTENRPKRRPQHRPEPIVITLDGPNDTTANGRPGPSTSTERDNSSTTPSLQQSQTPQMMGSTSVGYRKRCSKNYAPGSAFRCRPVVSGERPHHHAPFPPPYRLVPLLIDPTRAPARRAPVLNEPTRPPPARRAPVLIPTQPPPARPPPVQFEPKTRPQSQTSAAFARHGQHAPPSSTRINYENPRPKTLPEWGAAIVARKPGYHPPYTATNPSSFQNNLNPSPSQNFHRSRRSPTYRPHLFHSKMPPPPPPKSHASRHVQHPMGLQNASNRNGNQWSNEGIIPHQQDIQPPTHYRFDRFLARLGNYMEQHQRSRYHLADQASHQVTSVATGIEAHGSQDTNLQHHQSVTSQMQPPVPVPPHHQQGLHFPPVQNMPQLGHNQVYPQVEHHPRPQNPREIPTDPRIRPPNSNSMGQGNRFVRQGNQHPFPQPPPPEGARDPSLDDQQHRYHPH